MNDFSNDVIKSSFKLPVLVDFWAEWCGPCKMLSPTLEKLAEKFKDHWKLVKIDSDKNPDIAEKYGVRGIPNVKLFVDGEVVNEFTGALSENMVMDWLKKAIPSKNQKSLDEAKTLFSQGENDKSVKLLKKITAEEPENEEAKVLLAKTTFFKNPEQSLKMLEGIDEFSENFETADSLRTFARMFGLLNQSDSLPTNQVKDIYLEAIKNLQKQNFDSALENLIETIRTDRYYDDDGARKACIAIFKYLGEENEITLKYRRDFSSALYV
jgi:putative thioredoxin